jgi:hypothetical protein
MRRILLAFTLVAALVSAAPSSAQASPGTASGTVPGLTGEAALKAAGPAAERFLALRKSHSGAGAALDAQLHTSWGIRMPFSGGSLGMRALQSVFSGAGTTTRGGDYVYAPTAIPAGGACIEMTTAYTPSGPRIWAWDWCGGRDTVGKLTVMDSAFFAKYTTTVHGRSAYNVDIHRTSASPNTWTAYLFNYQTNAWESYYTSSGTYDLPQFPFGWNMFEIYSTIEPSTGVGYYCTDMTGRAFESSSIELQINNVWTPATAANAPTDSTPPPSGSRFQCPQLTFSVPHANDNWLDQIGGTPPPTVRSFEAEASTNTRAGQAAVRTSPNASGGALVGYVGNGTANYLQYNNITGVTAGTRPVTVYYASGAARSVQISVNGGAALTVNTPSTGGWDTIGSVTVNLNLNAGANTIKFGNTTGWAPDLDRITLT